MGKKTTIDITPDKSLIQKLGLTGYRTEAAISELVDNSIDARDRGGQAGHIYVVLDFDGKTISVADDGVGMDIRGLEAGLTVARSAKAGGGKLGRYGMGMKGACSTLGGAFTLVTATEGSDEEYWIRYDEDEWLKDKDKEWGNFEVETRKKASPWSGTRIEISKLKVALYPSQTTTFRKKFGIRYGEYIKNNQIFLHVNSRECTVTEAPIVKGSRKDLEIEVSDGRYIRGWIGLLEKRSIRGDYGIHLYRNNRLIRAFDKFGIRSHPEVAKITGRMDLDHVPVNFHKTGFIEESAEYGEAVAKFMANPDVVRMLRSSISRPEQASGMTSLIGYLADDGQVGRIRPRMSTADSRSLLQKAGRFHVETGKGNHVDFVFEDLDDGGLYRVEKTAPSGHRVVINRQSPVFRAVGNPLFLVGMIGLEAKEIIREPEAYGEFIKKRNAAWGRFVDGWSPKKAARGRRKGARTGVSMPKYSLAADLIGLHDHLAEKFEHAFQFTALGTLYPFLHNAYNHITYNVETIRGAGQLLRDTIRGYGDGGFNAVLSPRPAEARAMREFAGPGMSFIIRETSVPITGTWAGPEKAWVDLFVEVRQNTLGISADELEHTLDYMMDHNMISEKRVYSIARHRNILPAVRDYVGRTDE